MLGWLFVFLPENFFLNKPEKVLNLLLRLKIVKLLPPVKFEKAWRKSNQNVRANIGNGCIQELLPTTNLNIKIDKFCK